MNYEISPADVQSLRKAGSPFTLLDVREAWELEKAAIPGAVHIPMGDVPSRAHQ